MDDTKVEGLDSFSLFLPLPFRLGGLIVLGIWLWGLNLHGLHGLKIDVAHLIRYPARAPTEPPHHLSVYRFATILSIPLATLLLTFWLFTHGNTTSVIAWHWLPNLYLLLLAGAFFLPTSRHLPNTGRTRFLTTLRRISIGGLAKTDDGKFGDVLLADALTSYAKPLSELAVTLCMLVTGKHTTARPDRDCGGSWLVPLVMALPFAIRLRQCLSDHQRANALKYATAFPSIALSALQRGAGGDSMLFSLWLCAVTVNSLYSFYWDIAKDWDLTLFTSARSHPEHPFGLRRVRFLDPAALYYGVMGVDLLLRCTWSLKLSVHLEHLNDIEGGIFVLEVLEVARRWMWVYFRVETEWVRSRASGEVLMDDYGPRIDED